MRSGYRWGRCFLVFYQSLLAIRRNKGKTGELIHNLMTADRMEDEDDQVQRMKKLECIKR